MKFTIPGGFLLAVEGIDGVGKSAQVQAVARILQGRNIDCVVTREPTASTWGKLLRDSASKGRLSAAEELHAFLEDRKEHVRELIRPSLEAGKVVITDRYYFSTVAYQGARGFDPVELLRMNEEIAIEPHLLVLIDLDPESSLARIGNRDGMANHFETVSQLARSREIFLSLTKPYLFRVDGLGRPDDIRDQILLAFLRTATARVMGNEALAHHDKLNTILRLHGGLPVEG